jgi:anti-anti-sigma regulatory factor
MMRVGLENHGNTAIVRIEGKLEGNDACAAVVQVLCDAPMSHLIVDLSGVTYADADAEDALARLNHAGASFKATDCYSLDLCRRLRLRLA